MSVHEAVWIGAGLDESDSAARTSDKAPVNGASTSQGTNGTTRDETKLDVALASDSGTSVSQPSASWTKQAISNPQIVKRVVDMLHVAVNAEKHTGPAANIIIELAHISAFTTLYLPILLITHPGEARLELHTCNAILALVKMLDGNDAAAAANALVALAQHGV